MNNHARDIYQLPALNRTLDALGIETDGRHAAQIAAARLIAEQLDYSDKPTATMCAAYVQLLHDLTTQAPDEQQPANQGGSTCPSARHYQT